MKQVRLKALNGGVRIATEDFSKSIIGISIDRHPVRPDDPPYGVIMTRAMAKELVSMLREVTQ